VVKGTMMKRHFYLILLNLVVFLLAVLLAASEAPEKLLAFPEAEGFGAYP